MNNEGSIELREIEILRLVAKHRNFSQASFEANLSQSALTRLVQGAEEKLGFPIFYRTTRKVSLTEAGAIFLRETLSLSGILNHAIRRVEEQVLNAPKLIRVGIGRSLALAHLPGLFHAHQRANREVRLLVSSGEDDHILSLCEDSQLDVGFVSVQDLRSERVRLVEEIDDVFCLISGDPEPFEDFADWATAQAWLMPPAQSESRRLIDQWFTGLGVVPEAAMEVDSFDLMNQLVGLGLGVALVPRRSLSTFNRNKRIHRHRLPKELVRKLSVVVPNSVRTPEQVDAFVDSLLFS